MSRAAWRSVFALVLLALGLPSAAGAEGDALPRIDAVEVGFDGVVELGRWTPCRLQTTGLPAGTEVRAVVHAEDPVGLLAGFPGPWASADDEGTAAPTTNFLIGRRDSVVRVGLETRDGLVASQELPPSRVRYLRQSVPLVVTCGSPAGFETATPEQMVVDQKRGWRVVDVDSLSELPAEAVGLEGVDALVVAGEYAVGEDRLRAIEGWVRDGGHLVLAVGAELEPYRRSGFGEAEWVPFRVAAEPVLHRDLERLVSFSGRTTRIPLFGPVPGARIVDLDGTVLVDSVNGPLLATGLHGFGRVTILGIDLDRPPLTEWAAVGDFARRLAGDGRRSGEGGATATRRLAGTGVSDLATQLHAAQERFEDVSRATRWTVMSLVLLYVVVIGPLDYLLVHYVLRRPHLTWVTFPAVVVLAVVLGVVTADRANGDRLLVNELNVVDVDLTTDAVRGRGFATVYSPVNRRYGVDVVPRSLVASTTPVRVGWSGVPEDSYGGMYRAGGLRFGLVEYSFAPESTAIANVPIPIWESKSFRYDWTANGSPTMPEGTLREAELGRLSGTIRHELPGAIEEWFLVYNGRLFRPRLVDDRVPPLPPNTLWTVDGDRAVFRDLRDYLRGSFWKTIEGRDSTDTRNVRGRADYDVLGRNPYPILQMITFHQLAGGTEYTGLRNDTLADMDVTPLLGTDRAVLFGRLNADVAELEINGERTTPDRRDTFVRIVFPVAEAETESPDG